MKKYSEQKLYGATNKIISLPKNNVLLKKNALQKKKFCCSDSVEIYKEEEGIMKNKRIGIKLGKTVNMGNYESLRIDIELSGEIGDKEFSKVIEDLSDEGNELLEREIEIAITKQHGD